MALYSIGELVGPTSGFQALVNTPLSAGDLPKHISILLSVAGATGVVSITFATSGGAGAYSYTPHYIHYLAGESETVELDFGQFDVPTGLVLNCQVTVNAVAGTYQATLVTKPSGFKAIKEA